MECPILPVGSAVTQTLPVPAELAQAIGRALAERGYLATASGTYDPATAQALARFQDDHPVETGADAVLGSATGQSGLRFASCATYAALRLPCTRVRWSVAVWEPILGREAAIGAGAALALAADQGLVNLSCPAPPPGGDGGGGIVSPAGGGMGAVLLLLGLGALLLSRRTRG